MLSRHIPPRPPLFPFYLSDPNTPRIRVERLDRNHIVRRIGPHGHRFLEVIYLEQGGGWHRLGAQRWSTVAGDLFLIAPGEIHDASALEEAEGWVVLFTADVIQPLQSGASSFLDWLGNPLLLPFFRLASVESNHLTVPPEDRPVWSGRLQALEAELRLKRPGYKEAAKSHLTLMLVEAARLAADVVYRFSLYDQPQLAKVFGIIEARYAEPISLSDVAKAVELSPAYLTTLVRRLTGRTVLEWIAERRMAEARRLLRETNVDISNIGARVGYTDPTYFIRQFRRAHGMTPREWRWANR